MFQRHPVMRRGLMMRRQTIQDTNDCKEVLVERQNDSKGGFGPGKLAAGRTVEAAAFVIPLGAPQYSEPVHNAMQYKIHSTGVPSVYFKDPGIFSLAKKRKVVHR